MSVDTFNDEDHVTTPTYNLGPRSGEENSERFSVVINSVPVGGRKPRISITVACDTDTARNLNGATWLGPVLLDVAGLPRLPQNWNSHGAGPVDAINIARGLQTLGEILHADAEPPRVFPMANSGVNFEWSRPEFSIQLSVDREFGTVLSYTDDSREWDGAVSDAPFYVLDALKQ